MPYDGVGESMADQALRSFFAGTQAHVQSTHLRAHTHYLIALTDHLRTAQPPWEPKKPP